MNTLRTAATIALAGLGVVVLSCATDTSARSTVSAVELDGGPSKTSPLLAESPRAKARLDELRARFPALGTPVATGFERSESDSMRVVLPAAVKTGRAPAIRVELPMHADGECLVEEGLSGASVRFRLQDAKPSAAATSDGYVLYAAALEGADVVHRVHAEGTEDYVIFEERPAHEELRYDVDISGIAGLRLVSNTLELMTESGSPALRIAPPYVIDARGARHNAKLAVSHCAVDTSPAAPWGRPVTRPGAQRCTVHVTWSGIVYPAMVDPAWIEPGGTATGHFAHTATMLASGKVLIAGGQGVATAELFDPAANGGVGAFAATGSMSIARGRHTASMLPSGKVLVAGGLDGGGVTLPSAEQYDPATGLFTPTGAMSTARRDHAASVLVSGRVLVVGGGGGVAELFDPAANGGVGAFFATGATLGPHTGHTTTRLASGKVLIAGGGSAEELFDPAANGGAGAFATTGPMAAVRYFHTASVLVSGKVLVAGGHDGNTVALGSAELFDPAANGGVGAFAAAGSMATARYRHTASVLATGKVLVAGGNDGTYLATAELYDPALNGGAGLFAAIVSMGKARGYHTATVLTSGTILVAGGYNGVNTLASAELFGGVLGDRCPSGSGCLSGLCVDGVCCNTACSAGGCDRCDLPGTEGTCTVAPAGNPGANATCAFPYACDGVGAVCPTTCASDAACALAYYCAPNGTCQARKAQAAACNTLVDCKVAGCRECTSGNCVDGVCCNAACTGTCQACVAALKQSGLDDGACGPIKDGTDPGSECAPAGVPCGADGLCNGAGACRLFTPAGASCGAGVCQGTVARGELCNGTGTCAANAAGFECAPFLCAGGGCTTTCSTSNDCAVDGWCNAGRCEKRRTNGKACSLADQCSTNLCVDGFCCNALCGGQCEACNVAGTEGTCAAVSGAPHGARPPCAQGTPDKPCSAARCDATERTRCAGFVGSSVTCGTAACTQGTATAAGTCDGKASCQAPAPRSCGAYACGAVACNESCTNDVDCAAGSSCDLASSKCMSGATCDGDHTAKKVDGTTQDCTPYKCDNSGTCRVQCSSADNCAAPALCNPNNECVSPDTADDASGCGVTRAPRGTFASLLSFAGIALLFGLRRRVRRAARRPVTSTPVHQRATLRTGASRRSPAGR